MTTSGWARRSRPTWRWPSRASAPEIEEFAARYPELERRRAGGPRGARAGPRLARDRLGPRLGVGPGIGAGSSHRVGPPDRRLSGGPRAGSRRYGDGLRGRARGPGPPGGAQGAGHARRARFIGAAAVLERSPHRGRAAPYAHRTGLRCRPGRRPLLLRHAADRRERAGLGRAPSPPEPAGRARRRRGPGQRSVRWCQIPRGRSGTSSINSRTGTPLDPRVFGMASGGTRRDNGQRSMASTAAATLIPSFAGVAARVQQRRRCSQRSSAIRRRRGVTAAGTLVSMLSGVSSDLAVVGDRVGFSGRAGRDRSGAARGVMTSRFRLIRRADRPIFAGSPRWVCSRPMRWRTRIIRA